jgi:predicted anti-sigma-YlaC factor YlaD
MSLTCQTARLMVSEYMNGELDAEAARLLEAHLHICDNCPPLYTALVEVRRRLRRLPHTTMPPGARQRLRGRLQRLTEQELPDGDHGGKG